MERSPIQLKKDYVQILINQGKLKEARKIMLYGHIPFDFRLVQELDREIAKQQDERIRFALKVFGLLLLAWIFLPHIIRWIF